MENRDEFPQPAEKKAVQQPSAGDREAHAAAAAAIAQLLQSMGDAIDESDTQNLFRELVESAKQLCRTESAGLSLREDGDASTFRWRAAAGPWTPAVGSVMSCDVELLADTIEHREPAVASGAQLRQEQTPPVASALLAPFYCRGEAVGTLWAIAHDRRKHFDDADGLALRALAHFAAAACQLLEAQVAGKEPDKVPEADVTHRLRELEHGEASLRDARARLEAELEDSRMIQAISSELIQEDDVRSLYGKIIDASVSLLDSDFASMQVLEAGPRLQLRLFTSRGFTPEAERHWDKVDEGSPSACGIALRTGRRVVIPDVELFEPLRGTADLEIFRKNGIRAVQTTPLLSRAGRVVGMLSTHWREPHEPTERDLGLFDILVRQAADLVETRKTESELKEEHRRKDTFIAALAHELRNPLAPALNALHLLRATEELSPQGQWARDVIERQIQQLTRLIDDLLDVTRISRGRMDLRREPVPIARAIESAVEISQSWVDERHQTLEVGLSQEELIVDADPARLTQIFSNLLNNAARYSPEGKRICLTTRRADGEVVVTVQDDGIGIPPPMLTRIFDPFTQLDRSDDRPQGGLGIGLTLVKRLVEMHGGSVTAESDGPGHGSKFVVRLPLAGVGDQVLQAARRSSNLVQPVKPCRILVVDDNEDGAKTVELLLSGLGYEVRTAFDGVAGFELAEEFHPDVALLDLSMPRLNGFDLARRLREHAWGREVKLIAVSGMGQAKDKERASKAGFTHHLVKPADPAELTALLAKMCP